MKPLVETNLGPPWIIFSDKGKAVSILPAGRPGEVADVRDIPDEIVEAIVRAANIPSRSAEQFTELSERISSLKEVMSSLPKLNRHARRALKKRK